MLGVSCSPFSIATLFITPFSALGIWCAVHPGKCQQYGICYTYWSWYTVENNGPNFKRHGAKNRACCNMQTVNPPWMSCLKTKRAVFFITFVAWFVSWHCCRLENDGEMSAGGIFARLMLEFQALWRLGGRLAQVGWVGAGRKGAGKAGSCGTCLPVLQGCPCEPGWAWQGLCYRHPSAGRGTGTGDVRMRFQESLEGRISSPLSSVSTL